MKELKTKSSFTDIASRANVSSQTVINTFERYINCKRKYLPKILYIDEFKNLSFGKGKYACLLLDYQTGEIIDVLASRRLDYLHSYFNNISKEEKDNVEFLVSDMYDGYKHLHDYTFHNSTLVIDAFHYIRYITNAFDNVRIRIMKTFNKLIKMNRLYNYLDLKNTLMKVCCLFYINAVNIIKVLFVQKIKEAMLIRSSI